jgi:hypothetical protein
LLDVFAVLSLRVVFGVNCHDVSLPEGRKREWAVVSFNTFAVGLAVLFSVLHVQLHTSYVAVSMAVVSRVSLVSARNDGCDKVSVVFVEVVEVEDRIVSVAYKWTLVFSFDYSRTDLTCVLLLSLNFLKSFLSLVFYL